MENTTANWPVVKGDCASGDPGSRIAVVTLASHMEPDENAAIWGSCKTENLGAEKVIANVISNSNIRYILLCGAESRGHLAGQTLLSLYNNGIDENGRIIGSEGAIPFIENIDGTMIERFQRQVTFIENIGLTDLDEIFRIVEEYKDKGDAFPEEPMMFQQPSRRCPFSLDEVDADVIVAENVFMDTSCGLIYEVD
ncbi:tetrahydromethanopterin S-methyltransferase subunit A [Methanohalophilus levihalophilus]|uniref:tetrahydromethanopterin S-methyltransferase subunit A n=1 Tax=Methanohalophilus levihalophilus TaxID=1431282 RepID=UPI001AE7A366|nr:tetrahydromethanopterin S-methyltransferase subunit A [Methanohalophilus levihalophilus]MBP2030283.1 tetrahydromethanopterin S-methyltransferase subunit A [Methanohalophilus levihalophilus]